MKPVQFVFTRTKSKDYCWETAPECLDEATMRWLVAVSDCAGNSRGNSPTLLVAVKNYVIAAKAFETDNVDNMSRNIRELRGVILDKASAVNNQKAIKMLLASSTYQEMRENVVHFVTDYAEYATSRHFEIDQTVTSKKITFGSEAIVSFNRFSLDCYLNLVKWLQHKNSELNFFYYGSELKKPEHLYAAYWVTEHGITEEKIQNIFHRTNESSTVEYVPPNAVPSDKKTSMLGFISRVYSAVVRPNPDVSISIFLGNKSSLGVVMTTNTIDGEMERPISDKEARELFKLLSSFESFSDMKSQMLSLPDSAQN